MERIAVKLELFKKELLGSLDKGIFITPTEAAMRVYDCKNRLVAAVIASQNLIKLNISMADLLNRMGITDEEDVNDLKRLRKAQKLQSCNVFVKKDKDGKYTINENSNDFIEVDDGNIQIKALELTCKLKGNLKNRLELSGELKTTEEKITKLDDTELDAILQRIRAEVAQGKKSEEGSG